MTDPNPHTDHATGGEVQPATPADATATVDLSKQYCYRLDRTDQQPPRTLSWGAWEQAPAPMTTAAHAATYEAARVRLEHAYYGPMRVWIWQARPDEYWRRNPPQDAYHIDLGTAQTRSE